MRDSTAFRKFLNVDVDSLSKERQLASDRLVGTATKHKQWNIETPFTCGRKMKGFYCWIGIHFCVPLWRAKLDLTVTETIRIAFQFAKCCLLAGGHRDLTEDSLRWMDDSVHLMKQFAKSQYDFQWPEVSVMEKTISRTFHSFVKKNGVDPEKRRSDICLIRLVKKDFPVFYAAFLEFLLLSVALTNGSSASSSSSSFVCTASSCSSIQSARQEDNNNDNEPVRTNEPVNNGAEEAHESEQQSSASSASSSVYTASSCSSVQSAIQEDNDDDDKPVIATTVRSATVDTIIDNLSVVEPTEKDSNETVSANEHEIEVLRWTERDRELYKNSVLTQDANAVPVAAQRGIFKRPSVIFSDSNLSRETMIGYFHEMLHDLIPNEQRLLRSLAVVSAENKKRLEGIGTLRTVLSLAFEKFNKTKKDEDFLATLRLAEKNTFGVFYD